MVWQGEQLRQELPAALRDGLNALLRDEATSLLPSIRDFPLWTGAEVSFKANLLPSHVVYFLDAAKCARHKTSASDSCRKRYRSWTFW